MNTVNHIWESFQFPIKITNITCLLGRHSFPSDSVIEIHRDEEFNFVTHIHGKTNNPKIAEYSHPTYNEQVGGFIEGENIIGYDTNNAKFILEGCYVKSVYFTQSDDPLLPINFTLELGIDFLKEECKNTQDDTETLVEWFLTGKTSFLFPRNTYYLDSLGIRMRMGIDGEVDRDIYPRRMAWDYFLIELEGFSFIIQKVQDDVFPEWANGFAIEYRISFGQIPPEKTRIAITEIVSFMLGVEFINIGHSEYNKNNEVVKRFGLEPYGGNLIARCKKVCMPPMKFPKKHSRTEAEGILSEIISSYMKLRKELKLSNVLWKYWLARNSAIGINLPVLSSGLEGLAETYLKHYEKLPRADKETTKKYKKFLKDNSAFIEGLKEYSFSKNVINKIENPYHFGVGEKMVLFFNSLNMIWKNDSIENEALRSRNKMTHSSENIDSVERAKEAIRMTRAYETLFHRTLLKVLKSNDNYIDYYSIGHPHRNISENISKP